MPVLEVEVHGPDEESGLHHQVAVVELHVRVQGIPTLNEPQLLDPLGPELAAPAHGGVPVLVVRRPLAITVGPVEDARRGLCGVRREEPHTALGVVGLEPEVVERHGVHLAHLPEHVQGLGEAEVPTQQVLEFLEVDVQLLGDDRERPLQVVRFTQQARPHGGDLRPDLRLGQKHGRVVLGAREVLRGVDLVPASEDGRDLDRRALVDEQLQELAEARLVDGLEPPRQTLQRRGQAGGGAICPDAREGLVPNRSSGDCNLDEPSELAKRVALLHAPVLADASDDAVAPVTCGHDDLDVLEALALAAGRLVVDHDGELAGSFGEHAGDAGSEDDVAVKHVEAAFVEVLRRPPEAVEHAGGREVRTVDEQHTFP
mmetsp:Transcript_30633/g.101913  ORF Transcript_30633/g.101913 Transcript_30633/m.101913 type:complete len:372 (+) Transcript_30633:1815-2930(+)